ncbi:BrnA antitoxin family protein [Rhizobium tubonense]|uniref:BrnA antitoxin family protein n=1 Tax=Rhizobium tubonense TaxID=484088 RepID=UPI001FCF04C7|nr:BrnA antitoxin family protein [Rhizobium tubonense]
MLAKGDDRTDWTRVDALTDEDIKRSMREDPDWADHIDVNWADAEVVYPVAKRALSIRLDQDVIDFFQAQGRGYQTRINAVLRHFMTEKKKQNK